MKIAIITEYYNSDLNGSANYGGVLQAFALCNYLNNFGTEAVQICYSKKHKNQPSKFVQLKKIINRHDIISIIQLFYISAKVRINNVIGSSQEVQNAIKNRRKSVINFTHKIPHSKDVYTSDTILNLENYDVYITGSDQVWHIVDDSSLDYAYWLMFVQHKKKIAYAASIAMPEIPVGAQENVRNALKDFSAISVREKSDKENLERILQDKSVEWVLDPTMLLSVDDWNTIAKKNKYSDRRYIFTYILGDSKAQRKCVQRFAKKNDYIIINIPYLLNHYRSCDRKFGDIQISDVSPEMWISLIRDAEYVFTDSFHGSVFSVLFHKKFFAFKRDNDSNKSSMNSRLYSLFSLFEIENRIISSSMSPEKISAIPDIDYEKVDEILEKERKHSSDFLLNAINI